MTDFGLLFVVLEVQKKKHLDSLYSNALRTLFDHLQDLELSPDQQLEDNQTQPLHVGVWRRKCFNNEFF